MSKSLEKSKLYIGQLVTTSDESDAQVRTIAYIFDTMSPSPFSESVEVQWYEGTKLRAQGVDISLLRIPTIEQIENSIDDNGRLVNKHEILNLA